MAGDVEKFLLEKLNHAIEETKSTDQTLSARLFDLYTDFTKLKNLLSSNGTATDEEKSKRRETLYYLNNVLAEWQLISRKKNLYTPDALTFTYHLSKNIKKIKKKLRDGESIGKSEKTGIVQAPAPAATPVAADVSFPRNYNTYRWSSRTVDPSKVHGIEDDERFLERLLMKKSKDVFNAIAIVGVLGVGKTTLCQLMFNNQNVKQNFLPRIWICMSKQPEDDSDHAIEIVKRILMCLGVEDETIKSAGEDPNLGLQRLIFLLRLQLIGKKYLIVLDDAWNTEEKRFENLASDSTQSESCYEQLAYGLPKGQGGTVIVTCRSEKFAKKMVGVENLHQLLPLIKNRTSCWQIFIDEVEKDGVKFPENLKELENLIVDKCAGLPLVAKMMGEIMHQKLSIPNSPFANQSQQNQNHQQSQQHVVLSKGLKT